jgi:hypothetical protein
MGALGEAQMKRRTLSAQDLEKILASVREAPRSEHLDFAAIDKKTLRNDLHLEVAIHSAITELGSPKLRKERVQRREKLLADGQKYISLLRADANDQNEIGLFYPHTEPDYLRCVEEIVAAAAKACSLPAPSHIELALGVLMTLYEAFPCQTWLHHRRGLV